MNLQNFLKETYNNNYQLILFSEAKNAGLIAFNSAIIMGIASIIKSDLDNIIFYVLIYILIFNGISVLISLSSLAAQKRAKELKSSSSKNKNYLFYGTISHMKPNEYLCRLKEKYNLISENKELEFDLARQVIIISQIASRKFTRFNYALAFTIMSLTTPLGFIIYYYFFYPNKRMMVE